MLTRPEALSDSCLVAALADGWGVRVDVLEYLPLGFGSHHWRVDEGDNRWFVTVDDLDAKLGSSDDSRDAAFERLQAALLCTRSLRDRGLTFVVAPVRTRLGDVVRREAGRFVVALYPYIEGRSHSWAEYGPLSDRLAVLKLIVALHGTQPEACTAMRVEDFCVPNRDELFRAIDDVAASWDSGPYAEEARALLSRHADDVERLLARYDRLAHDARERPERLVVTHGEPHLGNTIVTGEGWVLIDWDTMLMAPPERDLWMLASDQRSVIDAYERATARTVFSPMLELYRLRWDVADIAIYVAELRRPHPRSADVDAAWTNLRGILSRLAVGSR
jgi:hypothetical protein